MKNKYENILIKTNNKAEKLAALYHLANLSGIPTDSGIIQDTIEGRMVKEYPYIGLIHDAQWYVGAVASVANSGMVVIPFSCIGKLDTLVKPLIKLAVGQKYKIGTNYIATVGILNFKFVLICRDCSIKDFLTEQEFVTWLTKNDAVLVK